MVALYFVPEYCKGTFIVSFLLRHSPPSSHKNSYIGHTSIQYRYIINCNDTLKLIKFVNQFSTQNIRSSVPHRQFPYKYLFTLQIMYTAFVLSPLVETSVILDHMRFKNRDTVIP